MKRVIKLIILSLVLIMSAIMLGGCFDGCVESCMFPKRKKAEKHCNEYLAAIPLEYEGYKILHREQGELFSNVPRGAVNTR